LRTQEPLGLHDPVAAPVSSRRTDGREGDLRLSQEGGEQRGDAILTVLVSAGRRHTRTVDQLDVRISAGYRLVARMPECHEIIVVVADRGLEIQLVLKVFQFAPPIGHTFERGLRYRA